jgi:cell division protein FtsB
MPDVSARSLPSPGSPRGSGALPFGIGRRYLALAIGLVVVVWVGFVFARAIAVSNAAAAQAAALRADNAARAERLAAEQQELVTVQSEPFVRLQARAYGVGQPGEQPFALASPAASPRPIVPLGAAPAPTEQPSPLDAWLTLLFGP